MSLITWYFSVTKEKKTWDILTWFCHQDIKWFPLLGAPQFSAALSHPFTASWRSCFHLAHPGQSPGARVGAPADTVDIVWLGPTVRKQLRWWRNHLCPTRKSNTSLYEPDVSKGRGAGGSACREGLLWGQWMLFKNVDPLLDAESINLRRSCRLGNNTKWKYLVGD